MYYDYDVIKVHEKERYATATSAGTWESCKKDLKVATEIYKDLPYIHFFILSDKIYEEVVTEHYKGKGSIYELLKQRGRI